jgi:hypothetical protein
MKNGFLALMVLATLGCDGKPKDKNTPPPLNAQQKDEFANFLMEISDQMGAHAMVGSRDTSRIKLNAHSEQVRASLEQHGCKLDTRNDSHDYPTGKEVKSTTDMMGAADCPSYKLERHQIITDASAQGRTNRTINGRVSFLIRPNVSYLQQFDFQSSYTVSTTTSPRGGVKNYHSTFGSGKIYYNGGKFSFKMGNDVLSDSGSFQHTSRWDFVMGAYTAVIETDGDKCKLNSQDLSAKDCALMIANIREIIDSKNF